MKAYETVDETGREWSAAQSAALRQAQKDAAGWAEATMLADGRLRVYVLGVAGLIDEVRYVAADGATEVQR